MKCTAAIIESLSLPLIQPLTIGDETLHVRSGLRLYLKDEAGRVGRGDIMPLPGFSVDDLVSAQAQVDDLLGELVDRNLVTLDTHTLLPSVRLGLEMAWQDLIWQTPNNSERWQGRSVALNALVMADAADRIPTVSALLESGYTSLKVKVGRQSLERDIETVRQVRDLSRDRATLRLDANGLWSLEQALAFGREVGPDRIDYIEEPVADAQAWTSFYEQTGIPLALDAREASDYMPQPGITTWVLKPALLGGVSICHHLYEQAQEQGLRVVLSSLFESPHALRFYARLAVAWGLDAIPQGLDTWRWLEGEDLALAIQNGRLSLS